MTKWFESGISKVGIKAFNEGRITLWFHGKKGITEKEYNSKIWAIRAIQKAKNEGRHVWKVTTFEDRIIISFNRKEAEVESEYRQYTYGYDIFTNCVVCRPLASWEIGIRYH